MDLPHRLEPRLQGVDGDAGAARIGHRHAGARRAQPHAAVTPAFATRRAQDGTALQAQAAGAGIQADFAACCAFCARRAAAGREKGAGMDAQIVAAGQVDQRTTRCFGNQLAVDVETAAVSRQRQ